MGDKRAKTELFSRWTQGSMVIADEGNSTGNRFWVDSSGSDSAGYGKSPEAPFASLDYASTQCTANQEDIIYVMAGHTESVVNATDCNLAVAGVRVVGLGTGTDRPTFTFTTANTAVMTVDAANVTLDNLILVCGKDGQTIMMDVNADDVTVKNCELRNDATYQAVTMLDINGGANGADRAKVLGCKFISATAGATAAIELGEAEDGVELVGNNIFGDFASAGIHNPTGKTLTNLLIKGNVVANTQTGDHAIEIVSACTGACVDNRLYADTMGTILDPGSLYCNGNLATDAIDQSGVPVPTTPAAAQFDSTDFAADTFNSTHYAADAFDSTMFVDGAFDSAVFAADSITKLTVGTLVNRATADTFDTATTALFTVAGGKVLLKGIIGTITTNIEAAACAIKLQANGTTGTTSDLCATLDINNAQAGTTWGITGTPATALIAAVGGGAPFPSLPLVIEVGTIDLVSAADNSGSAKWDVWYIPLEAGATVTAT